MTTSWPDSKPSTTRTSRPSTVAPTQSVPWLLTRPTPFAVVHGDYRLDNLMFPPAGRGVFALDWQTVGLAPPGRDLAYFLGTALRSEERRTCESDLVAIYFDELRRRGVQEYSRNDCFDDYRLGQLQGPFITVLGCIYGATAERSPRSGPDVPFDGNAILRRHQRARVAFPGASTRKPRICGFLGDQRFRRHENRRCLGKPDVGKSHEHDGPDVVRTHLTVAKSGFAVNREE